MAKPTKIFSSHPGSFAAQPNLLEMQLNSFDWFLKKAIKELFEEISPIKDYTGEHFELYFLDYTFDEPKYDEETARFKDLTYEAALRARTKLINHKTKETKEQEVYLGDFPIMTERGTFIINGVERVVVAQLIRSAGVYFTANLWHGKKLFGAKIIPNRGAWLEFETDADGFLGVKIDRRRKVAVTDLLRVFPSKNGKLNLTENEAILKQFSDIDTGDVKYIETTLKKNLAKTSAESYLEIYKRLRPGELATSEHAQKHIDAMFQRFDRYDISPVGRFRLNQRLDLDPKTNNRLLSLEDIVTITREIIRLNNNPQAEPDDIDHLGSRRVRPVGELLENRMRVGFARMRRIVQDRMSTSEDKIVTSVALINARPLTAIVKEFFASSQLSQFMDQVNPLAELEHKRRISTMGPGGLTRERAGFEVRDVHRSYYGRICPIETPEGSNIGLVSHLANFTRLNEFGFLITPYARAKNGQVTDEIVWLTANEEEKYKIIHSGVELDEKRRIKENIVDARIHGEPGTCLRTEVDFMDVAPNQLVSVATSLIPFLEHDDANRALMGSNMQRQAVVSVKPQAPIVGTGMEEKVARDSQLAIFADDDGVVEAVDAKKIVLKTKSGKKKIYNLHSFKRSNQFTCISQRPTVTMRQRIKKNDLLADGPSIENGVLALGQNLLVAFLSWEGANFEDAIIISERVVRDDLFTSIHIEDFYCDVRDTKLGPEITTPDIPNVS